ncbi:PIN-like domain-containing protein [Streptomyces angustmyceticus]
MPEKQGLFAGFEAQRTPTDADYGAVLRNGLVALDTNVLLDLYRMNSQVRTDMLTVLHTISERLWVAHQVIIEFWRNRQSEELISYHEKKAGVVKDALRSASDRTNRALDDWVKNVHIGENINIAAPMYEKLDHVRRIFSEIEKMLDEQAHKDRVPGIRDTNTDPVIGHLEDLLDGRVGQPYTPERYAEEVNRAKERAERQLPPGYLDFESGKKGNEEAAGDYLVWRQLLDEASNQEADVLFVTRDLKDDWWRKASSRASRLPRVELVNEFRDATGGRLFMVEPSVLMQQVSANFKLERKVNQNSVAALQRFEEERESAGTRSSDPETRYRLAQLPGGRSGDYAETIQLMTKLVEENSKFEDCIDAFMRCFPSVTLPPEARRRLMNLVSLGLSVRQGGTISLTSSGRKFLETRDPELLSRLFMERIEGAFEVRSMLREGVEVAELKDLLVDQPTLDLSATQIELLLRWMGKLGLLTE